MTNTKLFPSMVLQMTQIGEESGSLDGMLSKIADFYEREVDDAVAALSSLLEPIIIVFLGVVIGGLVVAMYLPIFKLGVRSSDAVRGVRSWPDAHRRAALSDAIAAGRAADRRCVVGLCVGSFLNVVIHRLPKMLERGWAGAVRRAARRDARSGARLQPRRPALGLSRLRRADHRAAEHPVVSWLALRRQVRGLQGADLRALSDRRGAGRAPRRVRRSGASARRRRASPPACSCGRCSRSR